MPVSHLFSFRRLLMKAVFIMFAALVCASILSFPVQAEEQGNYEPDARYAESQPPTIPHPFKDTADGRYCLRCHSAGLNGAPLCPHPVRITCTECHIQGEIKARTSEKRMKTNN
jgi:nitrate reductase (cytochrome), electron transfer subunit